MPRFVKTTRINAPAAAVFAWHEQPEALSRLIPPWERVVIERPPASLRDGERAVLRIGRFPFRLRWIAEHDDYINRGAEGGAFTDTQVRGPFRKWQHRHIVEADGPDASRLTDRIDYEMPLGLLGRLAAGWLVRRKLQRMFEFRHRVTREALEGATDVVNRG